MICDIQFIPSLAPLVDTAQPTDKIGQKKANARHQLQAKPTHTVLDWTTGLSYFPFLDKFLCLCLESNLYFRICKYLATMDDHNNDNS